MKKPLLVFGIISIVLAVVSFALTALFFMAYIGTHDGTYEMARNQRIAVLVFGILAVVLLVAGILMLRASRR